MPFEVVLGGIAFVITAVIGAGMAGKWVWGRELQAEREEKVFWRGIALRSTRQTSKALEVAKTTLRNGAKPDDPSPRGTRARPGARKPGAGASVNQKATRPP